MKDVNSPEFFLSENELLHLYSWMKSFEYKLDAPLIHLLAKIEKKLYEKLTIQEIENLKINRDSPDQ